MYIFLIVIHVVVCFILIATILLQAGKGAGLSEMFGGGDSAQSVLGTQAPAIIKKATTISAIAFLSTSLILGMVTARRGRSLFDQINIPKGPAASRHGSSPVTAAERPGKGNEVMPAKKDASQTEENRPVSKDQ